MQKKRIIAFLLILTIFSVFATSVFAKEVTVTVFNPYEVVYNAVKEIVIKFLTYFGIL